MKPATPLLDQRKSPLDRYPPGSYSPGIIRIEAEALKEIRKHDEFWRKCKNQGYMTWYSLEDHGQSVGMVMENICTKKQKDQQIIELGRTAGRMHDIGKVDIRCEIYRRNGIITIAEREKLRRVHPIYSDEWLEALSTTYARISDQRFIERLRPIVRYHHIPFEVAEDDLREVCIDLHLVDIFVSCMEKRHTPGRSQFQALDKLAAIVEEEIMERPHFSEIQDELHEGVLFLKQVYGFDLDALTNEQEA